MHKLQFNLPNVLDAEMGLHHHIISIEVRSRMCLAVAVDESSLCLACLPKYFANELEDSPLFARLFASLKCWVILVFNFCCVHPM